MTWMDYLAIAVLGFCSLWCLSRIEALERRLQRLEERDA